MGNVGTRGSAPPLGDCDAAALPVEGTTPAEPEAAPAEGAAVAEGAEGAEAAAPTGFEGLGAAVVGVPENPWPELVALGGTWSAGPPRCPMRWDSAPVELEFDADESLSR
jgi:hypothetical protein